MTDYVLKVLDAICRFLEAIFHESFGDPMDSRGDTVPLALTWTVIVAVSQPCILQLYNPSAAPIWLSLNGKVEDIGGIFPNTAFLVWDRFRGTVYARGPAGSQLNYLKVARWGLSQK